MMMFPLGAIKGASADVRCSPDRGSLGRRTA